ncbi:DoxX family protein [Dyella sp.]|uniref:DoxX family protein n=1 Tax=Dyella sp. TaxID=1869338 RepID=UPI003F7CE85D
MNTQNASTSLLARALLASLFLISGFGKLAAPAATKAYIAYAGLPLPDLAYVIAVVVEVGFGLALLAGYRTRLVAALMALFAVATALAFHDHFGDQNQFIHFLKNLAIAGGLLQFAATGAGDYSLDAVRQRRRTLA